MTGPRALIRPSFAGPLSTSRQAVELLSNWFSPLQPIAPQAPVGTPVRESDYPVGYNLNMTPRGEEEISFTQLRQLATALDLVSVCIETRKDQVARIPWVIRPTPLPGEPKADLKERTQSVPGIAALTKRFERPDGQQLWHSWIRMTVHEQLVIDAICVLPTKLQGQTCLSLVDGATIKVLTDSEARTPQPPSPAYQQVLKGLPSVDIRADELFYYQRSPRIDHFYGYSPIEQIITTVNLAIRRSMYKLGYYTAGNLPEAIIQLPENWPIAKIQQFSEWWNSLLSGQLDVRRQGFFIPSIGGAGAISYPKQDVIKDEMDEWIARVVCSAFSLPVHPYVRELNRSTGQTAADAAKAEGLQPLLDFLQSIFTDLIHGALGRPDLEFGWQSDDEPDLLKRAQIQEIQVGKGLKAPNEIRHDNGDDPVDGGDKPGIITGSGFIPLGQVAPAPAPFGGEKNGKPDGNGKEPVAKVREVAPGDAFRAERAKRALVATTKLTARFLSSRGEEAARRLKAAYAANALTGGDGTEPR